MAEHDGVGGRGDWQGEGVGAGDAGGESEIDGIDAERHRHLGQDGDQHVGRGRVGGDVRYLNVKMFDPRIIKY